MQLSRHDLLRNLFRRSKFCLRSNVRGQQKNRGNDKFRVHSAFRYLLAPVLIAAATRSFTHLPSCVTHAGPTTVSSMSRCSAPSLISKLRKAETLRE